MSNTNDELIQELKDARLAVHRAAEARDEARFVFLEKKAAYAKAMGVVEEILIEIETGKTGSTSHRRGQRRAAVRV